MYLTKIFGKPLPVYSRLGEHYKMVRIWASETEQRLNRD